MTKITQPPESTNNLLGNERIEDIEAAEETVYQPQNELPFPTEVDLNELFPEEDKDLNELFPDEETKVLLKKMQKNKKDLHIMTDRFLDEDWSSDALDNFSGNGEADIKDVTGTRTEEIRTKINLQANSNPSILLDRPCPIYRSLYKILA